MTSTHLLYIILFQIILINIFFGVIVFDTSRVLSESSMKARVTKEKTVPGMKTVTVPGTPKRMGWVPEKEPQMNAKLVFKENQNVDPLGRLLVKMAKYKKASGIYKIEDHSEMKYLIATTYDLSYASCGKYPAHPEYGITFSGTKAVKGRTIAVDPEVIPLGSLVYIEFPKKYVGMNGWYKAEDIGSKVKGKIVDVFLGESAFHSMENFGSQLISVKVIPQN